jgi:hypothetical protein
MKNGAANGSTDSLLSVPNYQLNRISLFKLLLITYHGLFKKMVLQHNNNNNATKGAPFGKVELLSRAKSDIRAFCLEGYFFGLPMIGTIQ